MNATRNPWTSRVLSARTDHLIDLALDEDIGSGDITTENLPDGFQKGRGEIVAQASAMNP